MRRVATARVACVCVLVCLGCVSMAHAQAARPPERRWSVEVGAGFDNSISGNINSSAIGSIDGQTVVITKNPYENVYGTGLHLRFGGGYMISEMDELRVIFAFQSLDADLTPMGDLGVSNLYAQYDDYQAFTMDFGYRRYHRVGESIQTYGEGNIGLGFVDATDVRLVAPAAGLDVQTDFFDQTAAFTLGVNGGVLVPITGRFGGFAQLGIRYVTGQGDVDDVGVGLDDINDDTARWTIPFVIGIRATF
jgi:hypothetical protein